MRTVIAVMQVQVLTCLEEEELLSEVAEDAEQEEEACFLGLFCFVACRHLLVVACQ